MECVISTSWLANWNQGCSHCPHGFGAHINILFISKVKIIMLIKWSYRLPIVSVLQSFTSAYYYFMLECQCWTDWCLWWATDQRSQSLAISLQMSLLCMRLFICISWRSMWWRMRIKHGGCYVYSASIQHPFSTPPCILFSAILWFWTFETTLWCPRVLLFQIQLIVNLISGDLLASCLHWEFNHFLSTCFACILHVLA